MIWTALQVCLSFARLFSRLKPHLFPLEQWLVWAQMSWRKLSPTSNPVFILLCRWQTTTVRKQISRLDRPEGDSLLESVQNLLYVWDHPTYIQQWVQTHADLERVDLSLSSLFSFSLSKKEVRLCSCKL